MIGLKKPTLLLDRQKCLVNIQRMKAKADRHHLIFRPHFKTHQSAGVGEWFRQAGIDKITVSSVSMAEYFAGHGWQDITIAFPVNVAEAAQISSLAGRVSLNILVEDPEVVGIISRQISHNAGVFIKIDTGYHRTGVDVDDHGRITEIIRAIRDSGNLNFKGVIVHNGQTYHAASKQEILEIHRLSVEKLGRLKKFLKENNVEAVISVGDTPSMSLAENFDGVDEIRPGNFVFYDVMQQNLGACSFDEIAVALACPVVAVHPNRHEVVVYGGAVHLSKDHITDKAGRKMFGSVVRLSDNGWSNPLEGAYVKSLSQEHGIIQVSPGDLQKFRPGDFLGILPVHSCLTVDAMRVMYTPDGTIFTTLNA